MFHMLTVMVTCVNAFIKIYRIVDLKWMQYIEGKL